MLGFIEKTLLGNGKSSLQSFDKEKGEGKEKEDKNKDKDKDTTGDGNGSDVWRPKISQVCVIILNIEYYVFVIRSISGT